MARRGSSLGRSVLDLDVDDSKFSSGLERNRRKAMGWTTTLGKDFKKGLGQGLGIAGGVGVAMAVSSAIQGVQAVVAGSIDAAMKWESAFTGVRKTVDASEAEFAALSGELRGMAKEMPIAATELAGLAEAAGALGIAKDDIAEFTRVTAMIGTTTDVSSDQAATSLGQLSNVLDLTAEDYERFGSTLVDLGNKGASTESQILGIASRAGAGAKLLNMATDETLAWSSAVANLGIEVEAGGSSLQTFFLRSAKSMSEGGEKLETYARVAGTSAATFKRAFEEDATGALQTFLAALGQLSQGEQLKVLSDLGFKDVRITRLLLGLAGNVDNLGDSLEVANVAWDENLALATEAEKRYGTTESKMQILGNRVNDLAITFGEELLPGMVDLATTGVEALEGLAQGVGDAFDEMSDDVRWFQLYFGELGKGVEDRANEIGQDVGAMKDLVLIAMNDLGMGIEEAMDYAERKLLGLPTAAAEAGHRMLVELGGFNHRAMVEPIEEGVAGIEGALLAGEEPVGAAMGEIEGAITAEAQQARDNAIGAMRELLAGITGLFDSDTDLQEAWNALIERMDDPYTEAERKADIFSTGMVANIRDALQSGDPGVTADAMELVNNMLTQIEAMEPGALASGTAVPKNIREGMNTQMSALIDWIETNVTGEALTALTLDEAQSLGLEGIYLYAQGIEARRELSRRKAELVRQGIERELAKLTGYSYGANFVSGISLGISENQWRAQSAAAGLWQVIGEMGPGSEPKNPRSPIRGITKAFDFVDILAAGLLHDLSPLEHAGRILADRIAMPLISMPHVSDVEPFTTGDGGFGTVPVASGSVTNIYQLHVEGRPIMVGTADEVLEEWKRMATFSDRSTLRG